ncbi:glycosyl transferase family protein [Erythrobacter mangrovi]|uniref:glycosyl transferase family protein n=1 Tax=Erythrobacter mangrovi TaxID=2739433 RepID=UPI001F260A23|nr:glycosyl transferase family protein [Erythrobacter mangrovi]
MVAQHELLLFTAAFFAVGLIDELAIDLAYLGLRLKRRFKTPVVNGVELSRRHLSGRAAVFIPAWQESAVIGPTICHMLANWSQTGLRIYVGCYRNDPSTIASVIAAARSDTRVRLVIHGADGPTSKADCLNRLYSALCTDETRIGEQVRMVVLHDAEDMVDPAALGLLDMGLSHADFVQLPVLALPQIGSQFIGTHYSDEFAEAHGKTLVVRDALGAAIPGAGVGCAISREILAQFGDEPFARHSLTEDYELGLRIAERGGRGRFLRCRTQEGRLIATRAYFPAELNIAVRQKTRWMHGIALQGWDRLGWSGSPVNLWMQLRDRRGPFGAILLTLAYALIVVSALATLVVGLGLAKPLPLSSLLKALLLVNLFGVAWRLGSRVAFTAREYGWRVGFMAIPRLMVSNVIAIMAGRRALLAYIGTLRGAPIVWDKTEHRDHPAMNPSLGQMAG